MTNPGGVEKQKAAYEEWYADADPGRWSAQSDQRPLVSYLRDLRIRTAVDEALKLAGSQAGEWDALVVCGGAGGEASYLASRGLKSVTVTDLSSSALDVCRRRDPRLQTLELNAESLDLAADSYDLVVVQEGLHHLPRPVQGLTEMLRVARRAVIVLEPHTGLVTDLIGTVWEWHGDAVNYVFRWNREFFEQCVASYLLQSRYVVRGIRHWEHVPAMTKIARRLPNEKLGLLAVKSVYGVLNGVLPFLGNKFMGVVVKNPAPQFYRGIRGRTTRFAMPKKEAQAE